MYDHTIIAENYLADWNAADSATRAAHLNRWAEEARYIDLLVQGVGRQGMVAIVETARTQFPGRSLRLISTPDGHGPFVRVPWTLTSQKGAPVARGTDIVRLDAKRPIDEVIGFHDGNVA
jgi:hypothetical protein